MKTELAMLKTKSYISILEQKKDAEINALNKDICMLRQVAKN
jgi:hypothetical protein